MVVGVDGIVFVGVVLLGVGVAGDEVNSRTGVSWITSCCRMTRLSVCRVWCRISSGSPSSQSCSNGIWPDVRGWRGGESFLGCWQAFSSSLICYQCSHFKPVR